MSERSVVFTENAQKEIVEYWHKYSNKRLQSYFFKSFMVRGVGVGFFFRHKGAKKREFQWLAWFENEGGKHSGVNPDPEPELSRKDIQMLKNLCKARYPWLSDA